MFNPNSWFQAFFLIPILNILVALYKLLEFLRIPGSLGFALVLLTVLIRILLHPLTAQQLKSAHKMGKLKPELDLLSEKYKNDKQTLHQEQLKLYREKGINPAGGCLPLLIQMPILIALYNLFFQLLNTQDLPKVVEEINKVVYLPILKIATIDLSFLGINLAIKPSDWPRLGWWLLIIPVLTAVLQYLQTKLMLPPVAKITQDKSIQKAKKDDDMAQTMQKQMGIMMPVMIGYFAYSFPLGLSLYWNANTVFGIIQQYYLIKESENEKAK